MGSFLSHHKGMIFGVVIVAAVFIGYAILKPSGEPTGDGLEKVVVGTPGSAEAINSDDPGAAFVLQLLAIQNIKFETKFFEDPIYRELIDQSRPLGEREVGRPNPFLDIGADGAVFPDDATARNATNGGGFIQTSTETPAATTTPATNRTTPRR